MDNFFRKGSQIADILVCLGSEIRHTSMVLPELDLVSLRWEMVTLSCTHEDHIRVGMLLQWP